VPDTGNGLAIVGPGLIGTSVALAARRRWPDLQLRTIDKDQSLSLIGNALVVVLAAPVDVILETIPRLPLVVQPHALIIDTGSTKRAIMRAAEKARLPQFVGGHPMAGAATAGPAAARADLFDGKPWFLTNPGAPEAVRRASRFIEALGARPVVLSDHGEEHDRLMAAVSHLPQLAATTLMAVVARAVGGDNLRWAGNGLRDTTRLAESEAAMWQGILATNQEELKPLVKYLAAELSTLADRLDDPQVIGALFEEATRARAALK